MLNVLWAALGDAGYAKQAKCLHDNDDSLVQVIDTLSRLERDVVRDAQAHRAIALCKAVLGGKRQRDEFIEQCQKVAGLI